MTPFRTALAAASSALALTAAAAPPASALQPDDRFALVNRCVDLRSEALGRAVATDVGPFRMQATALGRYLLYGKSGQVSRSIRRAARSPGRRPPARRRTSASTSAETRSR